MATDGLAAVRETHQRHREQAELAERAATALRQALCTAYGQEHTPEEIAAAIGWTREQVVEWLQSC